MLALQCDTANASEALAPEPTRTDLPPAVTGDIPRRQIDVLVVTSTIRAGRGRRPYPRTALGAGLTGWKGRPLEATSAPAMCAVRSAIQLGGHLAGSTQVVMFVASPTA